MNCCPGGREEQIQELLMRGYENRDISDELGISLRTVKAHMNRMFKRNGIRDGVKRVKLAVKLYRESLLRPTVLARST
jgi:DNA-binding NarL/FixJ family response regulator